MPILSFKVTDVAEQKIASAMSFFFIGLPVAELWIKASKF
jgi:hypothetical protein